MFRPLGIRVNAYPAEAGAGETIVLDEVITVGCSRDELCRFGRELARRAGHLARRPSRAHAKRAAGANAGNRNPGQRVRSGPGPHATTADRTTDRGRVHRRRIYRARWPDRQRCLRRVSRFVRALLRFAFAATRRRIGSVAP